LLVTLWGACGVIDRVCRQAGKINTRALVEAGKLSALTLILAFLSLVLPVFSFITIPLCAVPTIIIYVRHGFKYGILTAITAGFIIAIFMGPSSAIFMFLIILMLGVSQGAAIRKDFSVFGVIFVGLLGVALAMVLMALLTYYISGINVFSEQLKIFKESISMQDKLYLKYGLSKEEIASQKHFLSTIAESLAQVFPAVIVVLSGWISAFCCLISSKVLKRLGLKQPKVISLKKLQVPWFFSWGYLVGLAASFFHRSLGAYSEIVLTMGINLLLVFGMIFLIQGFAIALYFLDKHKLSFGVKTVILLLTVFIQITFQGLTWLGLFDTWFNYRKIPQEGY